MYKQKNKQKNKQNVLHNNNANDIELNKKKSLMYIIRVH